VDEHKDPSRFNSQLTNGLDIRGFDFKTWRFIPLPYLYAITKSITIVETADQPLERGKVFLGLLKNAEKY
jgi:hypothetical protein